MSVIVPFLDERESLPALVEELRATLDRLDRSAEVVLVDDGSTDGSTDAALAAIGADPRFRLVRLRHNCGKSAAIAAGRDHSTGSVLVTLDADLQDSPERIPAFLAELDAGADFVAGWRTDRSAPWHRRVLSNVFNVLTARITGIGVHDMNSGFKAYRREVIEAVHLSPGVHRYLAVIAHGMGYSVREVPAPHRPRQHGRSKFGPWRYPEAIAGFGIAMLARRSTREALAGLGTIGAAVWSLTLLGAGLAAIGVLPFGIPLGIALAAGAVIGTQLLVARYAVELVLQHAAAIGAAANPYTVEAVHAPSDT